MLEAKIYRPILCEEVPHTHTHTHTHTPGRLFGVYVSPLFSLENKFFAQVFGIHQTSFLPVEALELSELKAPLVYTFFPPKMGKHIEFCPTRNHGGEMAEK